MGVLNRIKGEGAGNQALHAIAEGKQIFVFKFIEANLNSSTTGAMTGINDQMAEIERAGWTLEHMAVGEGKTVSGSERIAIVCMYRRAI